jgi:4-alpha-glucanotransferase
VRYPVHAMVSHLAAFSHAHEVLVIGEDLGHVPEGFREMMSEAAILSYRILYFEQAEGGFRAARDYPRRSIACLSTHDLPTFRGWWQAHDVDLRLDYGLIEEEGAVAQRGNRERERRSLLKLLAGRKRMPAEWRAALADPAKPPPDSLVVAVHGFLAQSNALLAGVRIADLTGEDEPTNLPGTSGTYPNWRRA